MMQARHPLLQHLNDAELDELLGQLVKARDAALDHAMSQRLATTYGENPQSRARFVTGSNYRDEEALLVGRTALALEEALRERRCREHAKATATRVAAK